MKLNHLNLCTGDVPGLSDFFTRFFGFELLATRGRDAFAILRGDDGFALNLMRAGRGTAPIAYPDGFHVGFLVEHADQVRAKHRELQEAGLEPGELQRLARGGTPTTIFYCEAPGGVLVEVSAEAEWPGSIVVQHADGSG
jgi:catechol 2,3-dioxygenase-like lactoylglutathione lyase family enzyme